MTVKLKQAKREKRIELHSESKDWCHICGQRSFPNANLWRPANAEHEKGADGPGPSWLGSGCFRICLSCAEYAVHVLQEARSTKEK